VGFYIYVCECVCIERAGWTGGKVSEPRRKVLEIDLNVSKTALWAFRSGHEAKIVWVSERLDVFRLRATINSLADKPISLSRNSTKMFLL
jgi:hypothetical protein